MPLHQNIPKAEPLAQGWTANQEFLNADLFSRRFSNRAGDSGKVGVLMFEFSRFWPTD
jgi:hypothetical protein